MENAQPEPSMEEILASIRRIIAEDEDETPQDQGAQNEDAGSTESPILVSDSQGQYGDPAAPSDAPDYSRPAYDAPVENAPSPTSDYAPAPSSPQPASTVPQGEPSFQSEYQDPAPQPATAPPPTPKEPPMAEPARAFADTVQQNVEDRLLADTAEQAAASAFDSLTANVRVTENGPTLEAIVAELVKPMLKQWIDDHLPVIVEEKVEMEIKRIARRGR